ncbi:hypothetical protein TrLO_g12547 [Triparma laevis f. longispina]|uniref:Mitochondrial import inner membrane translocase subunit TIM50 n=1 Tax=Triparma laevis f. longispina TaxID=1714387 RepID=A0A9W6ZVM2_9STRA|nr:hypothetical protein TrLO_g12547 [Triparma laevis f. longispina]
MEVAQPPPPVNISRGGAPPTSSKKKDQGVGKDQRLHAEPEISVKCSLDSSIDEATEMAGTPPNTDYRTTYQVKPLLILDLNGVLCRRISLSTFNHKAYYPSFWQYASQHGEQKARDFYEDWSPPIGSLPFNEIELGEREKAIKVHSNLPSSLGIVAATPIVPFENLEEVLGLLENFTVGVWSSAMSQNVRQIVEMLFKDRKDSLLFIYGQEQCKCPGDRKGSDPKQHPKQRSSNNNQQQPSVHKKGKPTYMKPLARIFDEYHLWSAKSTIIFDDTPDKMSCNPKENVIIVEDQEKLTLCLKELIDYVGRCEEEKKEVDVREFVKSKGQKICNDNKNPI